MALIELISCDAPVAEEWMNAAPASRTFYDAHQQELKRIMRDRSLGEIYDMASGTAQHVRLVGLAQGLSLNTAREGNRITREMKLNFQEIPDDDDKTRRILLFVLSILSFFVLVFDALPRGLPEISDPLLLTTRIPDFRRHVQLNHAKFVRTYPDWAARATEAGLSGWTGTP